MSDIDREWEEFRSTLNSISKATSLRDQLNVISAQLNEIELDTREIPKIKEELEADENAENAPIDPVEGGMMPGVPAGAGAPPMVPPQGAPPMMPPGGAPMPPGGIPQELMKSDGDESGLSADGEGPVAEAVGMETGSGKVDALAKELLDAIAEQMEQASENKDTGKLLELADIQSGLMSLLRISCRDDSAIAKSGLGHYPTMNVLDALEHLDKFYGSKTEPGDDSRQKLITNLFNARMAMEGKFSPEKYFEELQNTEKYGSTYDEMKPLFDKEKDMGPSGFIGRFIAPDIESFSPPSGKKKQTILGAKRSGILDPADARKILGKHTDIMYDTDNHKGAYKGGLAWRTLVKEFPGYAAELGRHGQNINNERLKLGLKPIHPVALAILTADKSDIDGRIHLSGQDFDDIVTMPDSEIPNQRMIRDFTTHLLSNLDKQNNVVENLMTGRNKEARNMRRRMWNRFNQLDQNLDPESILDTVRSLKNSRSPDAMSTLSNIVGRRRQLISRLNNLQSEAIDNPSTDVNGALLYRMMRAKDSSKRISDAEDAYNTAYGEYISAGKELKRAKTDEEKAAGEKVLEEKRDALANAAQALENEEKIRDGLAGEAMFDASSKSDHVAPYVDNGMIDSLNQMVKDYIKSLEPGSGAHNMMMARYGDIFNKDNPYHLPQERDDSTYESNPYFTMDNGKASLHVPMSVLQHHILQHNSRNGDSRSRRIGRDVLEELVDSYLPLDTDDSDPFEPYSKIVSALEKAPLNRHEGVDGDYGRDVAALLLPLIETDENKAGETLKRLYPSEGSDPQNIGEAIREVEERIFGKGSPVHLGDFLNPASGISSSAELQKTMYGLIAQSLVNRGYLMLGKLAHQFAFLSGNPPKLTSFLQMAPYLDQYMEFNTGDEKGAIQQARNMLVDYDENPNARMMKDTFDEKVSYSNPFFSIVDPLDILSNRDDDRSTLEQARIRAMIEYFQRGKPYADGGRFWGLDRADGIEGLKDSSVTGPTPTYMDNVLNSLLDFDGKGGITMKAVPGFKEGGPYEDQLYELKELFDNNSGKIDLGNNDAMGKLYNIMMDIQGKYVGNRDGKGMPRDAPSTLIRYLRAKKRAESYASADMSSDAKNAWNAMAREEAKLRQILGKGEGDKLDIDDSILNTFAMLETTPEYVQKVKTDDKGRPIMIGGGSDGELGEVATEYGLKDGQDMPKFLGVRYTESQGATAPAKASVTVPLEGETPDEVIEYLKGMVERGEGGQKYKDILRELTTEGSNAYVITGVPKSVSEMNGKGSASKTYDSLTGKWMTTYKLKPTHIGMTANKTPSTITGVAGVDLIPWNEMTKPQRTAAKNLWAQQVLIRMGMPDVEQTASGVLENARNDLFEIDVEGEENTPAETEAPETPETPSEPADTQDTSGGGTKDEQAQPIKVESHREDGSGADSSETAPKDTDKPVKKSYKGKVLRPRRKR